MPCSTKWTQSYDKDHMRLGRKGYVERGVDIEEEVVEEI